MPDAASIGRLVPPILAGEGSATVCAAFERSLYLETGSDLIAIASSGLHDGPLTIRLGKERGGSPISENAPRPGQRWTLGSDCLRSDDGLMVHLGKASVWWPAAPPLPIEQDRLRAGLNHLLCRLETTVLPEQGLIGLVIDRPGLPDPIQRSAREPIARLRQSLAGALAENDEKDLHAATDLLGLGPGLTPSGDDLLTGLLIACHGLGARAFADDLGRIVLPAARNRTTRISLAHLEAAASGYGAAPLHALLAAVAGGEPDEINRTLDVAGKIGHSSGFDAIGGIILAVSAWLHTAGTGRWRA